MASCSNCGAGLSGQFCARCGADNETAIAAERPSRSVAGGVVAARLAEKRHGVPALMSFFFPGLGQLIKGDLVGAVLPFVGGAVGLMLAISGVAIGIVLVPIVWIWSLHDAYTAPDGQTKRELKRLGHLAVILACTLAIGGCGSVTGVPSSDDGGTGGVAGKIGGGVGGDRGNGGMVATGGTTGSGGIAAGGSPGAGGAGTGGAPGTGGASPGCGFGSAMCSDGTCSSADDAYHCGTLCSVCAAGASCNTGECLCVTPGQHVCNGFCVDVSSNTGNCGKCGTSCAAGQSCSNGSCVNP